ncbi:PREDICTED: sushi, von Willebrand factor type A, EGF and pentraxin domain-containing protein 1-like [Branchiostoma belcheri]|uniref:Sushi, von Willebrand factor type A, EGF and pentraxin domain-containing protein 1-like n=1 Tax=Branchiostoma belcheri TaxID=7741 RepID=A0A6P4ZEX7_BRABE|nr:PREDICTED: sushi, von Willebrand factor type A, EGF and pentraxin domain-containing protein 1-like [Branchiostoma belcheri]
MPEHTTPPSIICPGDITADNDPGLDSAEVTWTAPVATDTTGVTPVVLSSVTPPHRFSTAENGTEFYRGTYIVEYRATDNGGNTKTCEFTIDVVPRRCEYYRPPVNGATACDTWLYGQFCTVLCNHLYEFATSPAQLYVCGGSGDWSTFPLGNSLPWPDCSERRDPNEVHKGLEAQYFVGDCHDESTQLSIKQQYLEILQGSIFAMIGACTDDQGNNACLVENVVVHSGGVNGTITTHKPITCSRLNPLPNAVAYPSNCTMSKTSYLDSCIFSCKPGYSSTNGQTTLVTTCGASSIPGSSDGTWTEPIDGFNCEGGYLTL